MEHILSIQYKGEDEAARIWVYDESSIPGLDKTVAVGSSAKGFEQHRRQFMPLTAQQCAQVAIALCPPREYTDQWQAFLADAEALLSDPEVSFKAALDSLRCAVDMLREAAAMVEATQAVTA